MARTASYRVTRSAAGNRGGRRKTGRDREQKTILQVYVASIHAYEYLLGKILAYMIVAAADTLISESGVNAKIQAQ